MEIIALEQQQGRTLPENLQIIFKTLVNSFTL